MALLEVINVSVEFAGRRGVQRALDGVSFSLEAGTILGIVGESGAGKSLTGTAILGLIDPPGTIAGGEIRFAGQRIDNLDEDGLRQIRGRRIGTIFQDPLSSLNPLLSVGDQLVETIMLHRQLSRREAHNAALDLLITTGIPSARDRFADYPHSFSGGMRQRVVIALALAGEPELIIADEPTTALDVSVQAQILDLLRSLAKARGTAIILITHDLGVIGEIADRVAVMYAGSIVELGDAQAVLDAPRHPYTAGLMAAVPEIGIERSRLAQISGTMPRLDRRPSGCPFHPRCCAASPRCARERPAPSPDDGRAVACFHPLGDTTSAPIPLMVAR